MTNYIEINDLAKAPARARMFAAYLLSRLDIDWTDWERDFLKDMKAIQDNLTTRQAEKLVELRDNSILYEKVSSYRLKYLIDRCWEARLDLSESDEDFIDRHKKAGTTALRKSDALRLKRCAVQLQHIDADTSWYFPVPSLKAA